MSCEQRRKGLKKAEYIEMRMSFWGRSSSEKYLALDIGTEVVKALVFEVDKKTNKGIILGVGKEHQRPGNMRSGAISHIQGVIESSKIAIEEAKKKAHVKEVKKCILGIAGELVKGTTTTVHYERIKSDIRIDISEVKEIIRQVQQNAYERIKKQLAWETGQQSIEVRLVNAALVDVRIDGYKVTTPINFQGTDVSMSVFNAYAPLVHLGALEKIADDIGVDIFSIVAEPYAVAKSVMQDDNFDFNAIFVDIGGGTTDVAVVRNGGLEGTKMFAIGGRVFTKRLAQAFDLDFAEAEKIKIGYSHGTLAEGDRPIVQKILREDSRVWLGGMEMALSEFSGNDFLPAKILLCGGGSGLEEVRGALLSQEWARALPFSREPSVSFLHPRDVKRIEDRTGELLTPQDVTPMALASLGVELLEEEKLLSGILRRATRKIA